MTGRENRKYRTLLANEARAYRNYVKWSKAYRKANASAPLGNRELLFRRLTKDEFSTHYRQYAKNLATEGGRYSNRDFVQAFNVRVTSTQLSAIAEFFTTNTDFEEKGIGRKPKDGESRYKTVFDATWLGKTREEFLEDFMSMPMAEQRRLLTMYYAYDGTGIGYGNEDMLGGSTI